MDAATAFQWQFISAVTMYQCGKEESMYYGEPNQGSKKHEGSLPLIGVNTFLPKVILPPNFGHPSKRPWTARTLRG